jgi:hypothetical protein
VAERPERCSPSTPTHCSPRARPLMLDDPQAQVPVHEARNLGLDDRADRFRWRLRPSRHQQGPVPALRHDDLRRLDPGARSGRRHAVELRATGGSSWHGHRQRRRRPAGHRRSGGRPRGRLVLRVGLQRPLPVDGRRCVLRPGHHKRRRLLEASLIQPRAITERTRADGSPRAVDRPRTGNDPRHRGGGEAYSRGGVSNLGGSDTVRAAWCGGYRRAPARTPRVPAVPEMCPRKIPK